MTRRYANGTTGSRGRVTVVADDPAVRHELTGCLARARYETISVGSGDVGPGSWALPSDVAILDFGSCADHQHTIPGRLRRHDAPVIALVEAGCMDSVVRALEMGVEDVLTKPVDKHELTAAVQRVVERAYAKEVL